MPKFVFVFGVGWVEGDPTTVTLKRYSYAADIAGFVLGSYYGRCHLSGRKVAYLQHASWGENSGPGYNYTGTNKGIVETFMIAAEIKDDIIGQDLASNPTSTAKQRTGYVSATSEFTQFTWETDEAFFQRMLNAAQVPSESSIDWTAWTKFAWDQNPTSWLQFFNQSRTTNEQRFTAVSGPVNVPWPTMIDSTDVSGVKRWTLVEDSLHYEWQDKWDHARVSSVLPTLTPTTTVVDMTKTFVLRQPYDVDHYDYSFATNISDPQEDWRGGALALTFGIPETAHVDLTIQVFTAANPWMPSRTFTMRVDHPGDTGLMIPDVGETWSINATFVPGSV